MVTTTRGDARCSTMIFLDVKVKYVYVCRCILEIYEKKRGIGQKVHPSIREVLLDEKMDEEVVVFNSAA